MTQDPKKMVRLEINGVSTEASEGTTILQAAREIGITIPALCYHPKISITGACRVCLVEANGIPVTSCTTEVAEGMQVTTNSPYIEGLRRDIIDLILSDHPYDCMVCQRTGDCELQELAYKYGIRTPIFSGERRVYEKKDGNPFIERDMEKCILCGRCTKICDEVQGVGAIDFAYKGFQTKVCPPFERDLDCEDCGQCVIVCPTGALVGRQWLGRGRYWEIKEVDTVCAYCGTGCNITLHTKKNAIIRATSREDSWNKGLLCVKGRFGYRFVNSPDRLKTPLIREKDGFREASWDEALRLVAKRLTEIRSSFGSDAIGGLSSAKCTNEDNFLFQKLMRAAIGTNNIDHCARLCHAPTVASLATIFGSGAMTNSIREIPDMEVIFIIGSNTKESHPV
ncbi:MAG: molybdopterin-dependent oxidoreductase, partial [Nitrospirales bacterium]|nr:molybdopterin-dependent oxidoreductase [Nitrospirales bacterium]